MTTLQSLIWPDLKPTIYHIRAEHYNYYTTDVSLIYDNNYKTSKYADTCITQNAMDAVGMCVLTRAASGHL